MKPPTNTTATRIVSAVGATALLGVALWHAVWVVTPWPLASRAEFAEVIVGVPEADAPGPALTAAMVVLLCFAAWLVAARGGWLATLGPAWVWRLGPWVIGAVLMLRGVGGFVVSYFRLVEQPDRYVQGDLKLYSPICVGIALTSLFTAFSAARDEAVGTGPTPRPS